MPQEVEPDPVVAEHLQMLQDYLDDGGRIVLHTGEQIGRGVRDLDHLPEAGGQGLVGEANHFVGKFFYYYFLNSFK